MASNQKIIYVYESFKFTTPNFLGTLFVENVRGRESYSFEYDADWLKSSANYMYLDPDLQLYAGRQYPTGAKNVFGLFADSSPDRWGRLLMTRRERILAEQEGRKPRKLLDTSCTGATLLEGKVWKSTAKKEELSVWADSLACR